jgi:hypothetical protein
MTLQDDNAAWRVNMTDEEKKEHARKLSRISRAMSPEARASLTEKQRLAAVRRHEKATPEEKAAQFAKHTATCCAKRLVKLKQALHKYPNGLSRQRLYSELLANHPMLSPWNCVQRAIKDGWLIEDENGIINFK